MDTENMGSLLIQKVHPAIETRPPKQGETFRMEHYQPDVDKDIFYLKVDSMTTDVVIVPENMEDLDPNIIAVEYKKEENKWINLPEGWQESIENQYSETQVQENPLECLQFVAM